MADELRDELNPIGSDAKKMRASDEVCTSSNSSNKRRLPFERRKLRSLRLLR